MSIKSFISSEDPLSDDIIEKLISHREEDLFVDYKETFDNNDEKHWLGLTADCMAFANTFGGYIVYGIKDLSFEIVGITHEISMVLSDTNLIQQKINRFLLPPITSLRSKIFKTNKSSISVLFIPESKGKTHIITKNATITHPSGRIKQILYPGMIYIRRSATNNIIDPEDLDFIINKRIDFYKETLLNRISKIAEVPIESQIMVFDPNSESPDGQSFIISDSPNAQPIKGISFTVSPKTYNEEVLSWCALFRRVPSFKPSQKRLLLIYRHREDIIPIPNSIKCLVKFSIANDLPYFYWLKFLKEKEIKDLLQKQIREITSFHRRVKILHSSAFFGKAFYYRQLAQLAKDIDRLNTKSKQYKISSPHEWFHPNLIEVIKKKYDPKSEKDLTKLLVSSINNLAENSSKFGINPSVFVTVVAIDCYLYTKKYIN